MVPLRAKAGPAREAEREASAAARWAGSGHAASVLLIALDRKRTPAHCAALRLGTPEVLVLRLARCRFGAVLDARGRMQLSPRARSASTTIRPRAARS